MTIKKILYATVIYDCKGFDTYLIDYFKSVFNQSDRDFEILILIDDADIKSVRRMIDKFNLYNRPVHCFQKSGTKTPVELRIDLISISYELDAEVLIFSDFDENVALNRVEEIRKYIDSYSFAFNDFFVVDENLQKIHEQSFFSERYIPNELSDWRNIKSFNYVGLGSMAINLAAYDYNRLVIPSDVRVLDWFIATKVLLDGGNGVKVGSTYANYRQHDNSYVGFDFKLDEKKLDQGLRVKKIHYGHFREYNDELMSLYLEVIELEKFIEKAGKERYIELVNSQFDTSKFCWWENIKPVREIAYVI